MVTKPCPDCGDAIALIARRHKCGWTAHANDRPAERDPDWWRCCHEDRGQRCAEAGSISPSTHGTSKGTKPASGQWYCPQHVPALERMVNGVRCPPPMGFDGLRAQIKRAAPKPHDFEAEAERIALQQEQPA